jgi:hypothetical protein
MRKRAPWILLASLFACHASQPPSPGETPQGSRTLAMDFLDVTPTSDFNQNLSFAQANGVAVMHLHLAWNLIEPSTPADCATLGTYQDPYGGALGAFDALLAQQGFQLSLGVLPSTTNISLLPTGLEGKAMDDPLVICRFEQMLDFVFSKLPNTTLFNLQLGNEIESFAPATDAAFWTHYAAFLSAVRQYVQAQHPQLPIGIAASLDATLGNSSNASAQAGIAQLNAVGDYVGVNYYPIDSTFQVKDPSVAGTDIAALVAAYPAPPIDFQEIGYPSSSTNGSTETQQCDFLHAVFQAWDAHPTQIRLMTFVRLNDLSDDAAMALASGYGETSPAFVQYLETLGLRTYSGADKLAFTQLTTETSERGWK